MKHHSANSTQHPLRRPHNSGVRPIVVLLMVALGVAGIVYGEADDSPGGQLIGVLLIVGAVALGVRMVRRR
jgi:hypothetical protein